jgi:hypothetical protein
MPERLTLVCKECSVEFMSPIQMDRGSFETATVSNNALQCPHGHTEVYQKEDYFFRG